MLFVHAKLETIGIRGCRKTIGSALTGKGGEMWMAEAEAWVMIPKLDKDKTGFTLNMLPLVLCKDCQHWNEEDHDCNIKAGHFTAPPDWFCADGKRKDSD